MQRLYSDHGATFRLLSMALALGLFLFAVPANADDPIDTTDEPQSAAQEAQEIQEEVDQQTDQIDQQLEDQQDQLDQQLDQADEQIEQQRDELDQQIDQRTDQLDERADEFNDQLDQAEEQAERQVDEFNQQLDQTEEQAEGEQDDLVPQDQRIRLGVSIDENVDVSEGLTIGEVMRGSIAADAGLRRGDVIVSIDGESFTTVDQLDRFMRQRAAGDTAEIIVLRDGQRHPMNLTFRHVYAQDQGRYDSAYGADQQQFANHGWLGITLQNDNQDPFGAPQVEGAVVASVVPGSPAADAGLQVGHRIVELNGERVSSVSFLLERLQQSNPGDRVELVVFAGGNERSLTATLADSSVFNVASHQSFYGPQFEYGGFDTFNTQSGDYEELVEMHRRMEEQHQRVEQMLNQMQQDIAEIRRQLDRHVENGNSTTGQDVDIQYSDEATFSDPDFPPEPPRGSLPPVDEDSERPIGSPPNPQ